MDKELLRIIIIATGLSIIVGMLIWGYIRNQRASRDMSYFTDDIDDTNTHKPSFQSSIPKGFAGEDEDLDLDVVPLGSARYEGELHHTPLEARREEPDALAKPVGTYRTVYPEKSKPRPVPVKSVSQPDVKGNLPRLLQFSVVAKGEHGFNGADLAALFNAVGLDYGSTKIFERLDINRMVDFGVASMFNPGTFPGTEAEMATFYTPGITFFMQPRELPDPVLVFDDLVRMINLIAKELDGKKWDAERKPLTEFTIKTIRKSLQAT